jgi:hypothetical protein
MPLYLDVHHKVDGLTTEYAAAAQKKDLEVQGKYGVSYIRYWYDEGDARRGPHASPRGALAFHGEHRRLNNISKLR